MKHIGLRHDTVEIQEYHPAWIRYFEDEKNIIKKKIGKYVNVVEHIGSTAVPGMDAKPIIDIAAAVDYIDHVNECITPLREIGFNYKGENGIQDRHLFFKGLPRVYFHLFLLPANSERWHNYILFRDIIRNDDSLAHDYSRLKQELSAQFPNDRIAYNRGKEKFIHQTVRHARGQA